MINRILLDGLLKPVSHYCHAVEANGIVWVSGLVGMRADGTIPDDTVAQFDIAMNDLRACLRAAGSDLDRVTKVRIFMTDITERAAINPRRIQDFGEHLPASTLVEVRGIGRPAYAGGDRVRSGALRVLTTSETIQSPLKTEIKSSEVARDRPKSMLLRR